MITGTSQRSPIQVLLNSIRKGLTSVDTYTNINDCDLCVEFAHILSNFITLGRKNKLTYVVYPLFLELSVLNTEGNLITYGR